MTPTSNPSLSSLSRAAAALEVRTRDLAKAVEAGEIPCVRVGESVLVDVDLVRELLVARARKAQEAVDASS